MAARPTERRHLLLAGGGHSHVAVLRSFSMRPEPGVRLTVVSPAAHSVYSGMVPGRLVGRYGAGEISIDVAALAARAGAAFFEDRVVGVDPRRKVVATERRGDVPYDLLSLDVGSRPSGIARVAACPDIVGAKPVEEAAARIAAFLEQASRDGEGSVVVVGGGAGGVEVAFALRARLPAPPRGRVTIVEAAPEILPAGSTRLRRLMADLVERYGIETRLGCRFRSFDGASVRLDDDGAVGADLVVWATGAEGLPFLGESGLPVDDRGFVWVDDHLRSEGAADVFAVGDCARMRGHPSMPRAGVFAVRQGPILDENLRRALRGRPLLRYRPQRDFLSLVSTGDGRAAVSYYGWAAHGRLWWRLKDRIDRRFVKRYASPTPATLRRGPDVARTMPMEPCGGCAAKVGPDVLARTLAGLGSPPGRDVALGLAERDDAAVFAAPRDEDLVFTVDAFPPFLRDPLLVGEVAALNALSDVYAMGGSPTAVLALVGVTPDGREAESDLRQMMAGASGALTRLGVPLVGGHSIEADSPLIGFAVVGGVKRGRAMTKRAAGAGERLLLTKPLGTGVVLAAARAGECPAQWTGACLAAMRAANDVASRVLVEAGVRACTDVSGFGLAGHLGEMLDASGLTAELCGEAIPALPGALELLGHGWRSSAHASLVANVGVRLRPGPAPLEDPRVALLLDPQTSGGLLAAVPEEAWRAVDSALAAAGVGGAWIGRLGHGAVGEIHVVLPGWSHTAALR